MKRNKMRLVAVAMSAMLAAGMIPVGAYGEELTAGDEVAEAIIVEAPVEEAEAVDAVGEVATGAWVVDTTVPMKWDDEKMTVEYTLTDKATQKTDVRTKAAVIDEEYAGNKVATCSEDGHYRLTAVIEGVQYHSSEYTIPKLNHKKDGKDQFVEIKRDVTKWNTCEDDGTAKITYQCALCGETYTDPNVVLEATGHNFGEWKSYIDPETLDNVILLEDGTPVLEKEEKDGTYELVSYRECQNKIHNNEDHSLSNCPAKEEKRETKVILSKKVTKAIITAQEGIADELVDMTMEEFRTEYPTDDDIELVNCTKDGKYQVTYYNAQSRPTSQRWYVVAAHHMLTDTVIEFENKDDEDQGTWDPETLKVTNHSCYRPITYYEVTHCNADGCPNKACDTNKYRCKNTDEKEVTRVKKVAEPEGDHIINAKVEREIAALANDGNYHTEKELKTHIADDKSITLSKNTATCEEDGVITVTFACKICKAVIKTIDVKTEKLGHLYQPAVGENQVAPTCEADGSYDAVIYCKRCGKELERREGVKVPRLAHTNETRSEDEETGELVYTDVTDSDKGAYIVWVGDKVVDPDDGSYLDGGDDRNTIFSGKDGIGGGIEDENEFKVKALLYTNCERCGNHPVLISTEDSDSDASIKIVSVAKQGMTCEFGSITLAASYTTEDGEEVTDTYTVPYWTTSNSYRGRTAHTPLPAVEEVREDGTYTVIRCQICGEILYEQKIKDAEGKEYKDGLVQDKDGVWRYYEEDKFAEDFTGIAPYGTGEFFVGNGVLCSDANGLNLYDGTWYFLAKGQIQRGYSGFALYDGKWFMIEDGELNTKANGLYEYMGGTFLFAAGQLQDEKNGLWQDADGTWYFLAKGQVQTQFSGVAEYDGAFFVVKDGVFQADYNGTVEYDGHTFKVVKGQLYGEVAA